MQARVKIADSTKYLEIPDIQNDRADLVIGMLFCHRPIAMRCVQAWRNLRYPANFTVQTVAEQDRDTNSSEKGGYNFESITHMRNVVATIALQMRARYLFFIDDDVEIPCGAIDALLAVLRANSSAKVCSGIYSKKDPYPNNDPTIWDAEHYLIPKWEPNSVFEIGGSGAGCMLIDTSIFSVTPQPWFGAGASEDVYFCDAVRRAGYQVLAHGGVLCNHWVVKHRGKVEGYVKTEMGPSTSDPVS